MKIIEADVEVDVENAKFNEASTDMPMNELRSAIKCLDLGVLSMNE